MSLHDQASANYPPGTVLLEDLHRADGHDAIILHPKPSADPNDPLNWPQWRKHVNFAFVSFYVLVVFALINIGTITWSGLQTELGFTVDILNDCYAASCAALMVGGIVMIPFALRYGRRPIYFYSLAVQCAMAVWSARMETVGDMMATQVIMCFVGALCEVLAQMTVADLYFVHERGLMNSIYIWTLTIGASVAPVPGGYIAQNMGWRWVWWFLAIILGVAFFAFFFLYEETWFDRHAPADDANVAYNGAGANESSAANPKKNLERFNAAEDEAQMGIVSTSHGSDALLTERHIDPSIPVKTYRQKLALTIPVTANTRPLASYIRHSFQPFLVMWHMPAVFYMALLNGATVSAQIIPITLYSVYMYEPPYNFTPAQVGLMGLPYFIGTLLCALGAGHASDAMILRLAKRNGGLYEPEMRLWLIVAATPFVAIGLLTFGLGLANGKPWWVLCIGLGITAFGTTPANGLSLTYLTDSYTEIISDCMVGVIFVKNLFPTIFVFALTPWVVANGLQNMMITLTIIVVVFLSGNLALIYYGKQLRARSANKYFEFADRQAPM